MAFVNRALEIFNGIVRTTATPQNSLDKLWAVAGLPKRLAALPFQDDTVLLPHSGLRRILGTVDEFSNLAAPTYNYTTLTSSSVTIAWPAPPVGSNTRWRAKLATDTVWIAELETPVDATSTTLNGLQASTAYHFQARTTKAGIQSTWGAVLSFTTLSSVVPITWVVARGTPDTSVLQATWNAAATPYTDIQVEYNTTGTFSGTVNRQLQVASAQPNVFSALQPGYTYYFRVRNYNPSTGTGLAWEAPVYRTTRPPAPSAPNLVAAGDTTLSLSWALGVNTPNTLVRIESGPSSTGPWSAVYTSARGSQPTATTVTGLTVAQTYYFRALHNSGVDAADQLDSAPSGVLMAQTIPLPPYNVSAVGSSPSAITVYFTPTYALTTFIEYSLSSTFSSGVSTVNAGTSPANQATSYTVTGLAMGGEVYQFRLFHIVNGIQSGYATTSAATVTPAPTAPSATAVSNSQINFGYTSQHISPVTVQWSSDSGFASVVGSTTDYPAIQGDVRTVQITGLPPLTGYWFRARHEGTSAPSAWTTPVSASTWGTMLGQAALNWLDHGTCSNGTIVNDTYLYITWVSDTAPASTYYVRISESVDSGPYNVIATNVNPTYQTYARYFYGQAEYQWAQFVSYIYKLDLVRISDGAVITTSFTNPVSINIDFCT